MWKDAGLQPAMKHVTSPPPTPERLLPCNRDPSIPPPRALAVPAPLSPPAPFVPLPCPPDAYRHAVEISPRDYRAWYGLGQTYELLQMPHYALYYYHKAAAVRPGDARMWAALGQCYDGEGVGLARAAVRCYQKALDTGDTEGLALSKLVRLLDFACCGVRGASWGSALQGVKLGTGDAEGLALSKLVRGWCSSLVQKSLL